MLANDTTPALLDRPSAAAYLSVSERLISQWTASAPMFPQPVQLPGRITRWRRSDLDDFIASLPAKTESFAIGGKARAAR
jgi:predicted DNA-binding transcriptional regulator AlpA